MVEFSEEEQNRIDNKISDILEGKITRVKARQYYYKAEKLYDKAVQAHKEAYKEWLNFTPSSWGHRVIGRLKMMTDTEYVSYLNGRVSYYQLNIDFNKKQSDMWRYILDNSHKTRGKKNNATKG